jgi:S-methylmethionine-dependent homocysteine/selenocysteine methylase
MASFADRLKAAPVMLTDGGIETRLIYEFNRPLPDFASFLPLFDREGRRALGAIYRSYMEVAADHDLPMQIGTPTWRAHPEGLARQGFAAAGDLARVNGEAVTFLADMRRDLGLDGQIFIAGVIGPRRDGYDPHGAPDAATAEAYHAPQVRVLAGLGVDLLYAPTFASTEELLGVARACAATGLPYALAPVIEADGRLPDGTPLGDAIARIDQGAAPRPIHFLVGCVHPTRFSAAAAEAGLARIASRGRAQGQRFHPAAGPARQARPSRRRQARSLRGADERPACRRLQGAGRLLRHQRRPYPRARATADGGEDGLVPGKAIAYIDFRRLDRGPKGRAERPYLHYGPLIVERRSLHFALRAPVETTKIPARALSIVSISRPAKHLPQKPKGPTVVGQAL